jgi:hypothetical protein
MTENEQKDLPHRFREKAFRFYEPIIAKAVELFPEAFTVEPRRCYNISLETFCARFRDAKHSLYENKWATSIDRARFVEIYSLIKVGQRGHLAIIGSLEAIRKDQIMEIRLEEKSVEEVQPYDAGRLWGIEIAILCRLAEKRWLTSRVIFATQEPINIEALMGRYDVDIEALPDGSFILT